MTRRSARLIRAAAFGLLLAAGSLFATTPAAAVRSAQRTDRAPSLPDRLTDAEFWTLVSDISEPGGYFQIADNYTSNELEIGRVFTMLRDAGVHSGAYLGVGPEQNFTYIAAIHPAMAFIVDIRRQAVMQHLMYKALFEVSKDRAEFISLLFSKPRPDGLDESTAIQKIWSAFAPVATDPAAMSRNKALIVDRLTKAHGFTFTESESAELESVIDAFAEYGPSISTRGAAGGRAAGNNATFEDLTGWSTDGTGEPRSFLATEDDFRYVKGLHEKNLIVPVSGDFGGPKAIRAIGTYLKRQGGTVSAFYVSNVEQYLFQDRKERAFYDNVAALPVTDASVFIRPYSLRQYRSAEGSLCPIAGFLDAVAHGRVQTNYDSLSCVGR